MAAVALVLPPCPGCAGGGEVNGLTCPECHGSTRLTSRSRRRWRLPSLLGVADRLAVPVGTAVRWSMTLPGLLGAAGVSYGLAATVHAVFGQVPVLAVAALTAGVFGLIIDKKLT